LVANPARCSVCGQAGSNGLCDPCRVKTKLDGVIALFHYHLPLVQSLIKEAKYRGHADALGFLSAHIRQKFLSRLPDQDWVFTDVPASRRRLTDRGFNQSRLLAKKIAGRDFPHRSLFIKTKETLAQATLTKAERQKNLRHSFSTRHKTLPEFVVICDDVITTGATLKELATLAKKRGTKEVWALTIAHG